MEKEFINLIDSALRPQLYLLFIRTDYYLKPHSESYEIMEISLRDIIADKLSIIKMQEKNSCLCLFRATDPQVVISAVERLLPTKYANYLMLYCEAFEEENARVFQERLITQVAENYILTNCSRFYSNGFIPAKCSPKECAEELYQIISCGRDERKKGQDIAVYLQSFKELSRENAVSIIIRLTLAFLKRAKQVDDKYWVDSFMALLKKVSAKEIDNIEELFEYCLEIYQISQKIDREYAKDDSTVRLVKEIQNCVTENIYDDISRGFVADHVGYNSDYISKVFSKETGMTISKFIQEEKLKQAVWLAENSSLSTYEIAAKLGYSNFSYFSKLFINKYGCTLKEYRSKIKKLPV